MEVNEKTAEDEKKEAEMQAKVLGWKPKDKYSGNPDNWRGAEEFLQHGRDTLPILRENNKRLLSEVQELKQTFKDFSEHHRTSIKKTEQKAYDRAMHDLSEKQRAAVSEQDVETFDKLEKEKEKIVEAAKEDLVQDAKPDTTRKPDPEFVKWQKDNSWYEGDSIKELRMTSRANEIAAVLQSKGRPFDAILATVREAIKDEYPDHFTNQRAKGDAAVNASTRSAGKSNGGKKGRTFNDLPADAQEACSRWVKDGLMTEAEYLKEYVWEE